MSWPGLESSFPVLSGGVVLPHSPENKASGCQAQGIQESLGITRWLQKCHLVHSQERMMSFRELTDPFQTHPVDLVPPKYSAGLSGVPWNPTLLSVFVIIVSTVTPTSFHTVSIPALTDYVCSIGQMLFPRQSSADAHLLADYSPSAATVVCVTL